MVSKPPEVRKKFELFSQAKGLICLKKVVFTAETLRAQRFFLKKRKPYG